MLRALAVVPKPSEHLFKKAAEVFGMDDIRVESGTGNLAWVQRTATQGVSRKKIQVQDTRVKGPTCKRAMSA